MVSPEALRLAETASSVAVPDALARVGLKPRQQRAPIACSSSTASIALPPRTDAKVCGAPARRSVRADYGRRQSFGSTGRIKNLAPSSGTSCRIAGSTFGSPGINVNPQTTVGCGACLSVGVGVGNRKRGGDEGLLFGANRFPKGLVCGGNPFGCCAAIETDPI